MTRSRVELPTLGVAVYDPRKVNHRYDGEISNYRSYMLKHVKEEPGATLLKKMKSTIKILMEERGSTEGYCVYTREPEKISIYTSVKQGLDFREKLFVRGHEEAHALEFLVGKENGFRLLTEIAQHHELVIERWPCDNEEARADLGGLIAIKRLIDQTNRSYERKENWFDRAFEKASQKEECYKIRGRIIEKPITRETFGIDVRFPDKKAS